MTIPGKDIPEGTAPSSDEFPAELLQAAERQVTHRLRHVAADSLAVAELRKIAIRRAALRLVRENQNRPSIKRP